MAGQKLIAKGDIPRDEGTKTSRKHERLVKERQTSRVGTKGRRGHDKGHDAREARTNTVCEWYSSTGRDINERYDETRDARMRSCSRRGNAGSKATQ